MKIQHKVTTLLTIIFAVLLLLFLGYIYFSSIQGSIYINSKRVSDNKIISRVLEFKASSFLQPTKDNGCWDEMVDFTKTKDTSWSNKNFKTMLTSYDLTNLSVYSSSGELLSNLTDISQKPVLLSKDELKELFMHSNVNHCFYKLGNKLCELYAASIVPVTDEKRLGESYGYLVTTKMWDGDYIKTIEDATGFNISVDFTLSDSSAVKKQSDFIIHTVKGIGGKPIAQILFQIKDPLSANQHNLRFLAILGILGLIIVISFITFLTRKWLTAPLKSIIESLSNNEILKKDRLLGSKNEFGEIANLVNRYHEQKESLIREIDKKTVAENALKESEERWKLLVSTTPDSISWLDPHGNYLYINHARYGLAENDLIGTCTFNYISEEFREGYRNKFNECLSTGEVKKYESSYIDTNSDLKWFENYFVPFRPGSDNLNVLVVARDITQRKQQQAELEEREKRLSIIIDLLPIGVAIIDQDRSMQMANPGMATALHMNLEAISQGLHKNRKYINNLCVQLQHEMFPAMRAITEQQAIHDFEMGIYLEDGSLIWNSVNAAPLSKTTAVMVSSDITERKRITKELLDSEQRYSTLVCNMPDMILIHRDGNILFVNDASVNIIGYKFEELIGTNVLQYLTEESRKAVQEAMQLRTEGKEIKDYEADVLSKTGRIINVIIKTERIIYDDEPAILTIIIDISERKQFEKSIQERELKLDTITRSANDAIIMIDNDGSISFWNNAAFKVFGYSETEALGKNLHDLLAPERMLTDAHSAFSQFKKTGKGNVIGKSFELSAVRKDEVEIEIEISLSGIKLNDKWGAVGILRDITERNKNIELLKLAKEEAERANKSKSEFLALMSHEIRTPINGVIGMTELTLTTQLSKTQREYLEAAQTSAYTLLDTINDILDFSKIEAGKLEIESIEFDLREMVERSVEILNVKAFLKEIELLFEIDPSFPHIFIGDSVRIRQILTNFISNAIKFTEKGEICVSVKMNDIMKDNSGKANVLFSVHDTGIGIAENKLNKIFSSFEQADRSTTRKYGGTGLGLSISRSLADLMGGRIWVESEVNVGSTFYFEVPLEIPDKQNVKKNGTQIELKNVLIVDDNETNLKIMHGMFQYWGINSTTVSDGYIALDLLKNSKGPNAYDLVILDMHMPIMDGITLATKIHDELHFEIDPLILMFSSVEKDDIKEISRNVGIKRYLSKPVKMQDLYELLTGLTSKEGGPDKEVKPEEKFDQYPGKTILIVEDNAMNMKLMNFLLVKTGARILNATNGTEAVHLYKTKPIDIILMDVHMPIMDGLEATRMIRSLEDGSKHQTVVALTAITMQGDRERCLESGMDDYISKPFKMIDLFAVLRKYLGTPANDEKTEQDAIAASHEVIDEKNIFDKEELLSTLGNNIIMVNEFTGHFTDIYPGTVERLNKAIINKDYEQITFIAHTLNGMSGNIRASRIKAIAEEIEILGRALGSFDELQILANQLPEEFEAFKKVLYGNY
jgi:two-component system, sensor histidine kinase and response regulator